MLVLQRKVGESIYIGDNVVVTVQEVSGDRVKISIDAPREITIVREELIQATKHNEEASKVSQNKISELKNFFKKD